MKRFLRVTEAEERYGPKGAWWRKHIRLGTLGKAVVRAGRIVLLDSELLDQRLTRTGQLLNNESADVQTEAIGSKARVGAMQ